MGSDCGAAVIVDHKCHAGMKAFRKSLQQNARQARMLAPVGAESLCPEQHCQRGREHVTQHGMFEVEPALVLVGGLEGSGWGRWQCRGQGGWEVEGRSRSWSDNPQFAGLREV